MSVGAIETLGQQRARLREDLATAQYKRNICATVLADLDALISDSSSMIADIEEGIRALGGTVEE